MRTACAFLSLLVFCGLPAAASTITVGGAITQSTPDGTGPASSNPSLNNITDLQSFTLTLITPGGVTGSGLYNLTGSSLIFAVPAAPASESSFGAITLNVTDNGIYEDFSLLACITGADCTTGNSLSANFRILAGNIGGTGVPAIGLDQPHPLDLLEDDGTTDIQGSITSYSNTAAVTAPAVTPEPPSGLLLATALALFLPWAYRRSRYSHSF